MEGKEKERQSKEKLRRIVEEENRKLEALMRELSAEFQERIAEIEKKIEKKEAAMRAEEAKMREQEAEMRKQEAKLREIDEKDKKQFELFKEVLVKELLQDKLITDSTDFEFQLKGGKLNINGKEQSDEVFKKYKKLVETVLGKTLDADGQFIFNNRK